MQLEPAFRNIGVFGSRGVPFFALLVIRRCLAGKLVLFPAELAVSREIRLRRLRVFPESMLAACLDNPAAVTEFVFRMETELLAGLLEELKGRGAHDVQPLVPGARGDRFQALAPAEHPWQEDDRPLDGWALYQLSRFYLAGPSPALGLVLGLKVARCEIRLDLPFRHCLERALLEERSRLFAGCGFRMPEPVLPRAGEARCINAVFETCLTDIRGPERIRQYVKYGNSYASRLRRNAPDFSAWQQTRFFLVRLEKLVGDIGNAGWSLDDPLSMKRVLGLHNLLGRYLYHDA